MINSALNMRHKKMKKRKNKKDQKIISLKIELNIR